MEKFSNLSPISSPPPPHRPINNERSLKWEQFGHKFYASVQIIQTTQWMKSQANEMEGVNNVLPRRVIFVTESCKFATVSLS